MHYLMFTGGEENGLFDIMFADLKNDPHVDVISFLPHHDHVKLYKLHHARSLNRRRPAPFRFLWESSRMEAEVRKAFEKNKELCLIFNNFSLPYFEPSQLKAWKRRYKLRLVLCFIDRLSSYFAAEARMYEKNIPFDAVYSYYKKDADEAGYKYFDRYYSAMEMPEAKERFGVYFWGSDTGRRKKIEDIYVRLCELGISSKLGICYAQGEWPRIPGIVYDTPRKYEEMLKDMAGADVLLDVIDGSGGVSLRYLEAVAYGKKLISNNPEIKNMRFYDPAAMLLINAPEDIDPEFIKNSPAPVPKPDAFSPKGWIDELDEGTGRS